MLHIAGFRGPAAIQSSAVTPFRVEFDPVRRVGHHQVRFHRAKQLPDNISLRAVPTHQAMLAQNPQVAESCNGILRHWRGNVGAVVVTGVGKEFVDLATIEAGQT